MNSIYSIKTQHFPKSLFQQQGFTLLEILITVMILGILVAFSWPSYMSMVDKSKYAEVKTQMKCMANELQTFKLENGYFPMEKAQNQAPDEINCFYTQESKKVPFNSKYDYENLQVTSGSCYIAIVFFGKDGTKNISGVPSQGAENSGFYQEANKDDLVYRLGVYQQSKCSSSGGNPLIGGGGP